MLTTKTRTTIAALVASASLAGVAVAPAVSQAQWHTIVVGGHVITHENFTEGGVSPCTRINGQLGAGLNLVGDDHDWLEFKGLSQAGKENATKELETNEAIVRQAEREAFEYGCPPA
jgi:hypothetical protein